MKKFSCNLLWTSIFGMVLFDGCEKNSLKPSIDRQPPEISVLYPMTQSIIGDTITFKVNALDNKSVAKVAFYIDNTLNYEDDSKPYEYLFEPSNMGYGTLHTFFAEAYDKLINLY